MSVIIIYSKCANKKKLERTKGKHVQRKMEYFEGDKCQFVICHSKF